MSIKRLFMCSAAALILAACQETQAPASKPAALWQPINGMKHTTLEVASTDEQHQVGLMNRTSMAPNAGMLFVFKDSQPRCFWMKNTLIPLTAAFVDERGVLLQTEDMAAQTLTPHCSKAPAKYVIEMNQGWFEKNQVPLGSAVIQVSP